MDAYGSEGNAIYYYMSERSLDPVITVWDLPPWQQPAPITLWGTDKGVQLPMVAAGGRVGGSSLQVGGR